MVWNGEIESLHLDDHEGDTIILSADLRPGDVIDLRPGRRIVLLTEEEYCSLILSVDEET